jgi:hypothetical protein
MGLSSWREINVTGNTDRRYTTRSPGEPGGIPPIPYYLHPLDPELGQTVVRVPSLTPGKLKTLPRKYLNAADAQSLNFPLWPGHRGALQFIAFPTLCTF